MFGNSLRTNPRDLVTETLRERVVSGLHTGRVRAGQRMPSVRALATELDVNERVVLAALQALAADGIVSVRQRSGAYVLPPQVSTRAGVHAPNLETWLIGVWLEARSRGMAPRALPELLHGAIDRARRVRAACIECNRDQLHLLSSELANDYGFVTESVHVDTLEDNALVALERCDVLVTTAFHAERVRHLAAALGKPWIVVTLHPDLMRSVGLYLRRGLLYCVVTDPKYERKLREMLAPFGPTQNLRVILVPRDDPADIPNDAATVVIPKAREYLRAHGGPETGPGRPIRSTWRFSDESTRDLLSFLMGTYPDQPRDDAAAPTGRQVGGLEMIPKVPE